MRRHPVGTPFALSARRLREAGKKLHRNARSHRDHAGGAYQGPKQALFRLQVGHE